MAVGIWMADTCLSFVNRDRRNGITFAGAFLYGCQSTRYFRQRNSAEEITVSCYKAFFRFSDVDYILYSSMPVRARVNIENYKRVHENSRCRNMGKYLIIIWKWIITKDKIFFRFPMCLLRHVSLVVFVHHKELVRLIFITTRVFHFPHIEYTCKTISFFISNSRSKRNETSVYFIGQCFIDWKTSENKKNFNYWETTKQRTTLVSIHFSFPLRSRNNAKHPSHPRILDRLITKDFI